MKLRRMVYNVGEENEKIIIKVIFKGRKYTAKSDDSLENMTEFEAIVDILSAIHNMIDDIMSNERHYEIKIVDDWSVSFLDTIISEKDAEDDMDWSDRIRMVAYAIIKAFYDDSDTKRDFDSYYRYQNNVVLMKVLGPDLYYEYKIKLEIQNMVEKIKKHLDLLEKERLEKIKSSISTQPTNNKKEDNRNENQTD